jgi:hypothetical protein
VKAKGIASKGSKVKDADNKNTRSTPGLGSGEGVAGGVGKGGSHHHGTHAHANHRASGHHDMAKTIPTHDEARNAKFEAEGRALHVKK